MNKQYAVECDKNGVFQAGGASYTFPKGAGKRFMVTEQDRYVIAHLGFVGEVFNKKPADVPVIPVVDTLTTIDTPETNEAAAVTEAPKRTRKPRAKKAE